MKGEGKRCAMRVNQFLECAVGIGLHILQESQASAKTIADI